MEYAPYNPVLATQLRIRKAFVAIREGKNDKTPFSVGRVEQRMTNWARENGIEIGSQSLYMSVFSIKHATREEKRRLGLAVSQRDLEEFPIRRHGMDLFFDTNDVPNEGKRFVYVDRERRAKYIINPAYETGIIRGGKVKVVAFLTAEKMNENEVIEPNRRYIKI